MNKSPENSAQRNWRETALQYEAEGRWDDARLLYRSEHEADPLNRSLDAVMQELRCSINICNWQRYEYLQRIVVNAVRFRGGCVLGETAIALPSLSATDMKTCAQRWAQRYHEKGHARGGRSSWNAPEGRSFSEVGLESGKRLKVGFLGCDFYSQATTYLMVGLLEEHDRSKFQYIAYDYGVERKEDSFHQRAAAAFDVFHRVRECSNASIAARIADDKIDILLFLKGPYDERCGVLALRPAPVQLAYLYYPASFGSPMVDAIVADEIVIPPELEVNYSEGVIRLPNCYQPNDNRRPLPERVSREAAGIPNDAFVLANLGQSYKITPAIFDIWCGILRRYPQSVLWLLGSDNEVIRNLRSEAALRGVAPSRLFFAPFLSTKAHISRLACADLMLDTFPYGGHTGTSDALWAGVPVVTLVGETFASRVAASIMCTSGLYETIATSQEEYEAIACELIADPVKIKTFKETLGAGRHQSALFDTTAYARAFEAMLATIAHKRVSTTTVKNIESYFET
jgi:protein O-GlcNAc transferase